METYVVMYDYAAQGEDELDLTAGHSLIVLSKDTKISGDEGWWVAKIDNKVGIVPSNFITPMATNIQRDSIRFSKLIGEGGFSKVYHGFYGTKEVAIKIPKSTTDLALESIVTEGKLNMQLEHPNIVKFIGFYENALVMEFSKGGNLSTLLSAGDISLTVVVNWARQIADGMAYLHDNNIIHRDLKSSNVLLNNPVESNLHEQILKITDFGLAREINHTTRMSSAGTYAWMSPEVIKTSKFSKASDVWSYGVLLWELLTCQTPYKGIEPFTIAYGIAVNKLVLPVHEDCPKEWSTLMNACWYQDPHDRPSIGQIQYELRRMPSHVDDFVNIQTSWKVEIDQILTQISSKEKELQSREDEMARQHQEQKTQAANLELIERQLKEKELDLLHKELAMILKPMPRKRRAKFNKNLLKKSPDELISGPKDFRHTLNIQPVLSPKSKSGSIEYFQTWRPDKDHSNSTSKYSSLPNLFKKLQPKETPNHMNQVEKIICNIGAMCGSILTGFDLKKSKTHPAQPQQPPQRGDLKYYTYHGKTSRQRSSLPGRHISTEV